MTDEVKKKRFKVPHTYVIICIIILIMAVLTYVVPAGSYERVKDEVTGRTVVDPDTFQYVDSNPVKPFDLFKDVTLGMQAVSDIIFFMFIISGSFNIIISTGALQSNSAIQVFSSYQSSSASSPCSALPSAWRRRRSSL